MTKFVGSMLILNENEVIFVKKGYSYEEIINRIEKQLTTVTVA